MNRLLRAVFIGLLCISTPAHAATIFSENYEVNAVADLTGRGWGVIDYCNGYCTLAIVTAPPGRSGKVLRMEYRGVWADDSHNARVGRTFPANPEIYGRYYRRTDPVDPLLPSYYSGNAAKQHYLKVDGTSPDGYPNGWTGFWWGQRKLELASQNPNSNDYSNMANIDQVEGRWYCVEYHWKMNTPNVANGVQEIWIDGVQTLGKYNMNWRDTAHANAAFTLIEIFRQGGANNQYRYEDDFVMATTRIGCSGAPSQPGDTTAPTTPVGLVVR